MWQWIKEFVFYRICLEAIPPKASKKIKKRCKETIDNLRIDAQIEIFQAEFAAKYFKDY